MMGASAGNIMLMSLAAFLLLRHYGTRWADGSRQTVVWRRRLVWGSSLSFGIYLLHPLTLDLLDMAGFPLDPLPYNAVWYVPLLSALALTIAGLSTAVLRATPGLHRLVP